MILSPFNLYSSQRKYNVLIDRRAALKIAAAATVGSLVSPDLDLATDEAAQPFGNEFPDLESLTNGEWWKRGVAVQDTKVKRGGASPAPTMDVPYRVRHGEKALFEGRIRRDPIEKNEIVVAN